MFAFFVVVLESPRMFDFVRKHNRIMQFLLFLLIFPSFVLFGIDGYNRFREKGQVVATVDGHDINQADWDAAHKIEAERLRASMPNLDARLLDSPEAKYATLERLVRERVLSAAADKARLSVSDARLARELQQSPALAGLRKPDGGLDMERYRQLAASQGMTPEGFENRVRADLTVRQVLAGVSSTAFAPNAAADLALQAFREKREVQVARFAPAEFTAQVNPSDADLQAYYQAHGAAFQAPEQAAVEYVTLDLDSLRKTVTPNEQDIKTYYEQNSARLAGQEERRASHILITVPKSAPAAEREQARQRADALLAQVRKAPDSFAEVARKQSQDPGSAANGGDLDFFARGAMTKPFEDAAFALKKGDISDIVASDFGFHIIRLTDIKAPKQRSFEEMRPEIEAELRKQLAQRKFAEAAETFSNLVYEQSDTLKPVAERLKLEVRSATGLTRQPAAGATGVLASPKLLAALFSADAIDKKRNTEAIELAPNQLAAARITQYTPARTLPLAEVRERVRQAVVAARSAELARQAGEGKLAAWKANPSSASLPAAVVVARDQAQNQPVALVEAALRVAPKSLPALVGVDLKEQGFAVVRVNRVLPAETAAEVTQQARAQYTQWWAGAEGQAYYAWLKQQFKAVIKQPPPATATLVPAS